MNAQDQAAVARVMARQEPEDVEHHPDCPLHEGHHAFGDELRDCECVEAVEADREYYRAMRSDR